MAGKAKIRIEGEDATAAAWNSAIGRGRAAASELAGAWSTAFAGISLAAIAKVGLDAIKIGDDLQKAAVKAGIGGKAISELAYAAKLADVDLSSLSTAIKKMQVAISQAASGGKEQISTLKALGLSVEDIIGLKADKQFERIAQQISTLKDPADRARAATELFGKAGADLLPLFSEGAEGIKKAREEAEKLGYSFSDEQLKRLSAADEQVKKLGASWDALTVHIVSGVLPAVNAYFDALHRGETTSPIVRALFFDPEAAAAAAPNRKKGGVGRPGGDASSLSRGAIGYAAAEAAAKEAAEYKKSMEDAKKIDEMFRNGMRDSTRDASKELDKQRDDRLDSLMQQQDDSEKWYADYKQREKDLTVYREQMFAESAAVFRDYFVNAIEDMINTGKFQWRGFLSFLVAELAKKQIGKLFDQILGSGSSSGGGILGSIIGAIVGGVTHTGTAGSTASSGWSGPRASGGPVNAGHTYTVGERGRELFRPGVSGSIVPNHALGGGPSVTVINHIDARGATVDAIKLLPSFGKQISDQTEERIVSRLRRDYYGLAT